MFFLFLILRCKISCVFGLASIGSGVRLNIGSKKSTWEDKKKNPLPGKEWDLFQAKRIVLLICSHQVVKIEETPQGQGCEGLLRAHRITLNCGREVGKNKIPKVGRAMLELL